MEILTQNNFENKIKLAMDLQNALCTNHTGKMSGLWSISTSCLVNDYCLSRIASGIGICSHCFSAIQQKRQKNTRDKLIRNTELLTACVYDMDVLPVINSFYFRFEAFGDLNKGEKGINQFTNYCNIARKNPLVKCALWTKNPMVIAQAIAGGVVIPENMTIVFSVSAMDFDVNDDFVALIKKCFPFIDKVFAVYTKKYISANNVDINCGARSCLNCNRCYHKNTDTIIREQLK